MNTLYNARGSMFFLHKLEKVREIIYPCIRNEPRNITFNNDKRLIILSNHNNPTSCCVIERIISIITENDYNAFNSTRYFYDNTLFFVVNQVESIIVTVFVKDEALKMFLINEYSTRNDNTVE